jgi:hypothetical protein
MGFKHKQYPIEYIKIMLVGDDGQNMNNGAPPPHALGLHGNATDDAMLARVDGGSVAKTSRFVDLDAMYQAIQEALLSNAGQALLGQLDAGSAWVDGTFTLQSTFDAYTVTKVVGVPSPKMNVVNFNGSQFDFNVKQSNQIYLKLRKTPSDSNYPVIQTCYPK